MDQLSSRHLNFILAGCIQTARLKLRTADGDAVTLYQTQLVDDLAEISDRRLQNRGLNIELWHEGGVFFGLARAP